MKAFVIGVCLIFVLSGISSAFEINLADKTVTTKDYLNLKGTVSDPLLKIGDKFVRINTDKTFDINVPLHVGKNIIPIIYFENGKRLTKNIYVKKEIEMQDIPADHWAKGFIEEMVNNDIIDAYPGDIFMPTSSITRGDILTWIIKSKSIRLPLVTQDISRYAPKDHWMSPYIKAAFDNKIVTGDIRQFNPFEEMKRVDALLAILNNFTLIPPEKITHPTSSIAEYLKANPLIPNKLARAIANGWFEGISDKYFDMALDEKIERAEIAKIFYMTQEIQAILKVNKNAVRYTNMDLIKIENAPQVLWATCTPNPAEKKFGSFVNMYAGVRDPDGLRDIKEVYVDFSAIIPGKQLFLMDNGEWGDLKAGDGIYSLQISLPEEVSPGVKVLPVMVSDYTGWQDRGQATFKVVPPKYLPPVIESSTGVITQNVLTLQVNMSGTLSPGLQVYADLGDLYGPFSVPLQDLGAGRYTLSYKVPLRVRKGEKILVIKAIDEKGMAERAEVKLYLE